MNLISNIQAAFKISILMQNPYFFIVYSYSIFLAVIFQNFQIIASIRDNEIIWNIEQSFEQFMILNCVILKYQNGSIIFFIFFKIDVVVQELVVKNQVTGLCFGVSGDDWQ